MTDLNPERDLCALCGDIAEGFASINDERYCHGEQFPTCYELAQALETRISKAWISHQITYWLNVPRLVSIRKRRGLTTAEVAERIGTTVEAVEKFEAPGHDPHLSQIRRYRMAISDFGGIK